MKIEQIAFAAKDPQKLIDAYKSIGIDEWVSDEVVATGEVFGVPATNKAQLHFNYQLGFELEILKYEEGANWHADRNDSGADVFQSHMGLHVDAKKMAEIKIQMKRVGIEIAQEVWTDSHTNPHIAGKRKYHYVVFDSLEYLGFDLKLIERIML